MTPSRECAALSWTCYLVLVSDVMLRLRRWGPNLQNPLNHTIWDQELYFNECFGHFRQTAEWIGVWDADEYISPIPEKCVVWSAGRSSNLSLPLTLVHILGISYCRPWTREWVHSWVSSLGNDVRSVQLPYTWVDSMRNGPVSNDTVLALDSSLTPEALVRIGHLAQNGDGVRVKHQDPYVKTFHRTRDVRGANVHHGVPGPGILQDPVEMAVYHVRKGQTAEKKRYTPYPISKHVLRHWDRLSERLQVIA